MLRGKFPFRIFHLPYNIDHVLIKDLNLLVKQFFFTRILAQYHIFQAFSNWDLGVVSRLIVRHVSHQAEIIRESRAA